MGSTLLRRTRGVPAFENLHDQEVHLQKYEEIFDSKLAQIILLEYLDCSHE